MAESDSIDETAMVIGKAVRILISEGGEVHLRPLLRKVFTLAEAESLNDVTAAFEALVRSCRDLAEGKYKEILGYDATEAMARTHDERIHLQGGL